MNNFAFAVRLADTAAGHRRLAETAETPAEVAHWLDEAERFGRLAVLAAENPEAARRAYRPTRAYEPAEVA